MALSSTVKLTKPQAIGLAGLLMKNGTFRDAILGPGVSPLNIETRFANHLNRSYSPGFAEALLNTNNIPVTAGGPGVQPHFLNVRAFLRQMLHVKPLHDFANEELLVGYTPCNFDSVETKSFLDAL